MGVIATNTISDIRCDKKHLTIRIARRFFPAGLWTQITNFVSAPNREGIPLTRPWRYQPLDWLSQLVYVLMVPADNFLVQLDREIDLSFVDEECAPYYRWQPGNPGRRPWPPQLMFRLLLLMFLFAVRFETQLVGLVRVNVLWRWFIGLGLLEKVPDHSTLHTFRKRLGPVVFVRILARILLICQEWKLVGNLDLYFDFTAVHASAIAFTPYQRAVLLAIAIHRYLDLWEAEQAPDQPLLDTLRALVVEVALEAVGSDSLKKVSPEQIEKSLARWEGKAAKMPQSPKWQEALEESAIQALSEAYSGRQARETSPRNCRGLLRLAKRLLARLPQARGDLDARLGKANNWEFFLGYLAGYMVDGLLGIITAVVFAAGNAWQAALLPSALSQHQAHIQGQARSLTIDSAFDFPCVHQFLDEAGLKGYITSRDHRGPKGCFGPDRFTWQGGRLVCPNDSQKMAAVKSHSDGTVTYEGTACAACAIRQRCVGREVTGPRTITLHPEHHRRWLLNRTANQSEEYKQAQKQRLSWENVFGHGNTFHNGDKAPYRSLPMNLIAELMTAIAINLEKMVRYGNRSQAGQEIALA